MGHLTLQGHVTLVRHIALDAPKKCIAVKHNSCLPYTEALGEVFFVWEKGFSRHSRKHTQIFFCRILFTVKHSYSCRQPYFHTFGSFCIGTLFDFFWTLAFFENGFSCHFVEIADSTGTHCMGCIRLVGSLTLQVSFAKKPYKRDYILQKRPVILRSLLIVATP